MDMIVVDVDNAKKTSWKPSGACSTPDGAKTVVVCHPVRMLTDAAQTELTSPQQAERALEALSGEVLLGSGDVQGAGTVDGPQKR
ncbi:hypothetical protein ColTof4_10672 [Colletotrichum tofieldiae]|nr:hypothetical protein ColTof3_06792 [Colletotrichum tofieldiae]GKT78249.1 hypothetical protein ColTof4_10672 [Colletotrichum tofieldiae]